MCIYSLSLPRQSVHIEPALLSEKLAGFVLLAADKVFANLLQLSFTDAASKWSMAKDLAVFLRLVLCESVVLWNVCILPAHAYLLSCMTGHVCLCVLFVWSLWCLCVPFFFFVCFFVLLFLG